MNKKLIIIPALLVAIGGGAAIAQTDFFVKAYANPAITAQQAKEIALKELNGTIVDFDYDSDAFTPHYEIEIVKDNEKVEYNINASSGDVKVKAREVIQATLPSTNASDVTQKSTTNVQTIPAQPVLQATSTTLISQEQAVKIAKTKASGQVKKVDIDEDDNRLVYEIEIRNGKTEYEFEIDAVTGAILKYEEDLED